MLYDTNYHLYVKRFWYLGLCCPQTKQLRRTSVNTRSFEVRSLCLIRLVLRQVQKTTKKRRDPLEGVGILSGPGPVSISWCYDPLTKFFNTSRRERMESTSTDRQNPMISNSNYNPFPEPISRAEAFA